MTLGQRAAGAPAAAVDIICAVYNGTAYLPEFLRSLAEQTHASWRLWVRDDGSSDASPDLIRAAAAKDARIRLAPADGERLGAAQSFGRLLARLPADASYIMFADQDDVWLPRKIERTLAVMLEAEQPDGDTTKRPLLVHTDLTVVDAELRVVHPSFWTLSRLHPEPATLRRVVVRNVATGAATMINRALRQRAGPIPREAVMHDWWVACVAAAFGRIVAVRESNILYRQHGANALGARADWRERLRDVPHASVRALGAIAEFRRELRRDAGQARAFLARFGEALSDDDRRFVRAYADLPDRAFFSRKLNLARYRGLPERGLLGALGALIRG